MTNAASKKLTMEEINAYLDLLMKEGLIESLDGRSPFADTELRATQKFRDLLVKTLDRLEEAPDPLVALSLTVALKILGKKEPVHYGDVNSTEVGRLTSLISGLLRMHLEGKL